MSLAATGALTQGHGFAGWARPAWVAVAGVLAARRAPFPVVVIAATTALLRLARRQLNGAVFPTTSPTALRKNVNSRLRSVRVSGDLEG